MTVCSEDVHSLRQSQERKGPSKYPRQPSIMHLTFDRPTHHRPNRSRTLSSLLFRGGCIALKIIVSCYFLSYFSFIFFLIYTRVVFRPMLRRRRSIIRTRELPRQHYTVTHVGNLGLRPRIKSTRILHQALISPPIPALHVTA